MLGYDIRCKYPYNSAFLYNNEVFRCIQLNEFHECGEIIDNYFLICNNWLEGETKYNKGEYVKVIDIRHFDFFATDINYDDRKDLKKVQIQYNSQYNINVNIYRYIN